MEERILELLKTLRNEIAGLRSDMQSGFKDVAQHLHGLDTSMQTLLRESLLADDELHAKTAGRSADKARAIDVDIDNL